MISKPFFNFVLPRLLNTGVLTVSLVLYTQQNQRLVWLGALFGIFMQILLVSFTWSQMFSQFLETKQTVLHPLLSVILTVSATTLGWAMTRHQQPKRASFMTRLALFLVPFCYILNQGLDINLYWIRNASRLPAIAALVTLTPSGLIAVLFSLVYYSTTSYAARWIQTCVFSTVVYFTGAIELSKLFGYIELYTNPTTMKSLIYTIRQSQQMSAGFLRRLFNALMGKQTSNWMSTGYSVYWFFISFSLMYKYWRQSNKA